MRRAVSTQKPCLDPRHLREGGNPQPCNLLGFERPSPAELADSGQDVVEPVAEIFEDVVAVHAHAMPRMEVAFRGEQPLPVEKSCLLVGHGGDCAMSTSGAETRR